ncbi:MAG: terminase small subunit [Pseudomonadota bacterium]
MTAENTEEKKGPGGRPPLYEDPDLLEAKIDLYFDGLSEEDVPSIAELAFELGFASRNALWEYEQKSEFSDTIKRAKLRLEVDRTKRLLCGPNTAGVIFDLTNNYGWKNPHHMKHSGDEDGPPIEVTSPTEKLKAFLESRNPEQSG